jgi:hypothetical protein
MKTSIILDDRVFEEAKKESMKTGQSFSEVVSHWASLGREVWLQKKKLKVKVFKPIDLGPEKIDIKNRKDWMQELDDDGN